MPHRLQFRVDARCGPSLLPIGCSSGSARIRCATLVAPTSSAPPWRPPSTGSGPRRATRAATHHLARGADHPRRSTHHGGGSLRDPLPAPVRRVLLQHDASVYADSYPTSSFTCDLSSVITSHLGEKFVCSAVGGFQRNRLDCIRDGRGEGGSASLT